VSDGKLEKEKGFFETILIVGTVRNAGNHLLKTVKTLDSVFSHYNIDYYLVESDSSDKTVSVLKELSRKRSNVDFYSYGILSDKLPNRIDRLILCRNKYLEYFRSSNVHKNYTYLVVADFDGVNLGLTKEAIISCISHDGWDVCTANQNGPYYDLWALRCANWLEVDCHAQYELDAARLGPRRAYFKNFILPMLHKRSVAWISTESSFGGLALYRSEIIKSFDYARNQFDIECEHVTFHRKLRSQGARIFMHAGLVNSSWTSNAIRIFLRFVGIVVLGNVYFKLLKKNRDIY